MKIISNTSVEQSQIDFYLPKLKVYKNSPKALAWRDEESQNLRFEMLSTLFQYENKQKFSVHEVGCGLAHYNKYLKNHIHSFEYIGSDIIPEMIENCRKNYPDNTFYLASISSNTNKLKQLFKKTDYYCLSGTFNTIQHNTKKRWEDFIFKSISNMFILAEKGIAFNFLSTHSDYYINDLYYADPNKIFNWCIKNTSRFVSILHNSPLYEFTVVIYKESYMNEVYPYILKRKNEK